MRKCEYCGEEFDVIDTQNAFDYITELSYLKVKPDLCFSCAVEAVDSKMKGIYFETCDCCGKSLTDSKTKRGLRMQKQHLKTKHSRISGDR